MDETRYNQDREMVREAVRVSGDPRKPPSARKNHLPVIAIPAVIALVFILYIIGWSLYASLLDYNVGDGLGSRFVGMENYLEVLYDNWMMPALGNTILMRLTNLVICAGLSALMCAGYRKMKNPGKILAAACLWLVPAVLPAVALGFPLWCAITPLDLTGNGLVYLAGTGLQTVGIFCFIAGLFRWQDKNPFHGLLAAVLVWLMQCLTVMTMDAGIHTRVKVPLLSDDRIAFMTSRYLLSSLFALAVIKLLLQGIVGGVAAHRLGKKTRRAGIEEKTTRAEYCMIPVAAVCVAVSVLLYQLVKKGPVSVPVTLACSLLVALGGAAAGGLIAWSFVRLLTSVSDRLFGAAALVLSAAMCFISSQYMLLSRLLGMREDGLRLALLAAFDWRVILLTVALAFVLRFRSAARPGFLRLSLGLLAGACTWGNIVLPTYHISNLDMTSGTIYYLVEMYNTSPTAKMHFGQQFGFGGNPDLLLNLVMFVPPLLLGAGAALAMYRAFRKEKEETVPAPEEAQPIPEPEN